jgi:hypothetical protein
VTLTQSLVVSGSQVTSPKPQFSKDIRCTKRCPYNEVSADATIGALLLTIFPMKEFAP